VDDAGSEAGGKQDGGVGDGEFEEKDGLRGVKKCWKHGNMETWKHEYARGNNVQSTILYVDEHKGCKVCLGMKSNVTCCDVGRAIR
jgi:hypothetical protein